ncbi:hypothetical protein BaRGS_00031675, partial [Batillaria attramentaria]
PSPLLLPFATPLCTTATRPGANHSIACLKSGISRRCCARRILNKLTVSASQHSDQIVATTTNFKLHRETPRWRARGNGPGLHPRQPHRLGFRARHVVSFQAMRCGNAVRKEELHRRGWERGGDGANVEGDGGKSCW